MKSTILMKLIAICLIIRVIIAIVLLLVPLNTESFSPEAASMLESTKMLVLAAVFVEIILARGIFRSNLYTIYFTPVYFLLLFILQFSGSFYLTFPSRMATALFYLIGIGIFSPSIMRNFKKG